jgi:hypothetical protein
MKKIINGKMYNTETAQNLAEFVAPLPPEHPDYCHEILYKKTNGEFYLYRKNHTGLENILPYTVEKSKRWIEKQIDDADLFIKIFGEVEE